MPPVCLIFKIHEPHRLRNYSFFDIGESGSYVDEPATRDRLDHVTTQCYLPATQILLKQIKEHKGAFRFSMIISGVTLCLFERFQPELIDQFKLLANTGCVEFIGESYFHSLSYLFSKQEYRQQLDLHRNKLKLLFGNAPETFADHAISYNNDLALEADAAGFNVLLSSGTDRTLAGRSTNRVYQPDPCPDRKLLFESPLLKDHIARCLPVSDPSKPALTAAQFMSHLIQKQGEVITLPVDLNAFPEAAPGESGLQEFLSQFPGALLAFKGFTFETPAHVANAISPCASVSVPGFLSWEEAAPEARPWIGNEMQKDAAQGLYMLEKEVKTHPDPAMLLTWRQLQVSDHFQYMDTQHLSEIIKINDANPYHSPYDAYINFMNILTDFSERLAVR